MKRHTFGDVSARAEQLRRAQQIVEASLSTGTSGTLLVSGLSGMGKTSLLHAITPAGKPWKVVRFKADAYEAKLPFAAIERLLHQLRTTQEHEPVADAAAHPRRFAALLLGEFDRKRHPVFLVIDDAQWLDPQSAMALRFAINRLIDGRFFAAVASRPMTEPNALLELLNELDGRSEQNAELIVDPLTTEQVQVVAARLLNRGISQHSARELREATGGSPALLSAAMALTGDIDSFAADAGIWEVPIPLIDAARNPFARLTAAAPEAGTNVAQICSVLRDPVELRVMEDIAASLGLAVDADEAAAAGLIAQRRWRGEIWVAPSHDLLAHAVQQSMSADLVLAIHRAAGDAVEGRRGLRHSLAAASRVDDALQDRVRTIVRGVSTPAQADEAIGYLRRVLALSQAGPEHDDVLIGLAMVAMRFRRQQLVLDLLPEFEALPPSAMAAAIAVEMFAVAGRLPEALAAAATVHAPDPQCDTAEDRILRAYIAAVSAQFLLMMDDMASIPAQVAVARRRVDEVLPGDVEAARERVRWMYSADRQHMRLLGWTVTSAARSGQREVFLAALGELGQLIAEAQPSPELVDVLVTRAGILMQMGDVEAVHSDMLTARAVLEQFPHAWTAGHVRVILTHVNYLLGDWEGSLAGADTAVSLAMDETAYTVRPVTHFAAALVRASRGEAAEVAALLEAGERSRISQHETYESAMAAVVSAELARAMGDPGAQLRACSDPALRTLSSTTHGWMSYRVEALAALGRVAEARTALDEVREASAVRWQPYYGSMLWLEARVEDAADRQKTANALYRQAIAEPSAALFPFPLARARADFGRFLLRVGDPAGAREQLERAAEVFARLGAAPDLERTLALLERAGGNGAGVPGDPFAPLTARERQIAHQASHGHTNREIAESLFLSVTTVNFHMRNVLPKLGLDSRRQLRSLARSR
ncbi:regulatory LuxR family protein [Microterricola gilva]|uniref:Regulatory LuxR family protein n=1 Tax=Microterricola gilva TaxID=393267 RepID=A0A4Q8AII8_9MICO|nr:LuxR family transcriptional regulator [Microterricola gilva]RZU64214.1 regulatory LuxR family protein [Microterricola gilva]